MITIRKMEEEEAANERAAAEQRESEANAQAMQAESERASAESAKAEANRATAEAERAKSEAQAETERASRDRNDAEAARAAALAQEQATRAQLDQARQSAAQAEQERSELREQLRQQLNMILETRETARGLIVNMSDVLFDTGQYTLRPGAREKLAKISGIILAHPGLNLEVEGHTDSVGSDDYNQRLSEERANSVRSYLVSQGVSADAVTAFGFGKTRPVTDNNTAAGRCSKIAASSLSCQEKRLELLPDKRHDSTDNRLPATFVPARTTLTASVTQSKEGRQEESEGSERPWAAETRKTRASVRTDAIRELIQYPLHC